MKSHRWSYLRARLVNLADTKHFLQSRMIALAVFKMPDAIKRPLRDDFRSTKLL